MHELIMPKEVRITEIKENLSLSPNNYKKLSIKNRNKNKIAFYLKKDIPFEKGVEPGSGAYVGKSNQVFLRNSCIDNIKFSDDKAKYIFLKPNYFDGCSLKNEDILMCTDANIGDCCLYLADENNIVYSSGIAKLNFAEKKYKWYVFAFMRDDYFREQLNAKTPKGATIRHSRDNFLSCEIPSCNEEWVYTFFESLVKNIAYAEKECRKKLIRSTEMFNEELMVKKYNYENPTISKISIQNRLDSSIYSNAVFQWNQNIKNYKNGYTDLSGFGFCIRRGPNLAKRDLGRSIQTDNYRKGYNILIYPSDISDAGNLDKICYLGARNKVWFLEEKYILFSSEGTIGKTFVVCDNSMKFTTNFHGTLIYPDNSKSNINKSIYLGLYLNYLRYKGIFEKLSVGANGGSFAVGYWDNILIPKVSESFMDTLKTLYDQESELNPSSYNKDKISKAGIYQLNNFIIKCKTLLRHICNDLKNEELKNESYYEELLCYK